MSNEKPQLKDLSYRELQELCKDNDLKANGKTEELIARLRDHFQVDEEDKEEAEEEVENLDGKSVAIIIDKDREPVKKIREYKRSQHGDEFVGLAKKYKETRPKRNLEVEIR